MRPVGTAAVAENMSSTKKEDIKKSKVEMAELTLLAPELSPV